MASPGGGSAGGGSVGGGPQGGTKLARVSYLPGVTPPPSARTEAADTESAYTESAYTESVHPGSADSLPAEVASPPDFASFFGAGAVTGGAAPADEPDGPDDSTEPDDSDPVDSTPVDSDQGRGGKRREVRAENVSMHALTRRGMSRWELEKTLLSRELDEETVTAELDRLEGVGLLDDAALAETFVRTQHERKGLGRGAITAELRRRHVDQEHIDAALEQVGDDDEQSRATELAVKRARQLDSYDVETAKRRLHGFLSRKGYSSSVVRAAIDEALSPRSNGVRFR